MVDRVLNNADFAKLAGWGINTAVVDFKTDGSIASWDSVVNAAASAGIKLIIWPDAHQGSDVTGCRWETPFDDADTNNGTDFLLKLRPILDHLVNNPNVIGIVSSHEANNVTGTYIDSCNVSIADLTSIKDQIHGYVDPKRDPSYTPFKVWDYMGKLYQMSQLSGYTGSADIAKIMDGHIGWLHCAGGVEGSCDVGTSSALSSITRGRTILHDAGLESKIDLVFLIQTFTTGSGYGTKFTLDQLQNYSCEFINTKALDGFGFYTWDAGWWSDLHSWTDLQPAIGYIKNTCIQ